jgi:hypothetical protein
MPWSWDGRNIPYFSIYGLIRDINVCPSMLGVGLKIKTMFDIGHISAHGSHTALRLPGIIHMQATLIMCPIVFCTRAVGVYLTFCSGSQCWLPDLPDCPRILQQSGTMLMYPYPTNPAQSCKTRGGLLVGGSQCRRLFIVTAALPSGLQPSAERHWRHKDTFHLGLM